ncbi:MAG: deoxyguanosinetriphosphate triphosphohydrolase [Thioalkalivibrionaceae bacterium]
MNLNRPEASATFPGPGLAPWAAQPEHSRGRRYPEPPPAYRSPFQRDRDRIVHSSAFRRLEAKTQVFVSHEGDLFRTRLTHSLEVAQIARSIARALGLAEDLVEAIALAHDLGHTPFGHAGQHALNRCMRDYGGFEHNLQSLRIVEFLEKHYADFDGLNLTFETREGILKHCSRQDAERLGEIGQRFLTGSQPGLEAQLANVADEIAYNNHDVDDGLRSGLIDIDALREVEIFRSAHDAVVQRYPALSGRRVHHETIRRMIDAQVRDLIETSRQAILDAKVGSIEDVRSFGQPLIRFSADMKILNQALKSFLRTRLYKHHRVLRMTTHGERVLTALFDAYRDEPRLIPPEFRKAAHDDHEHHPQERIIADYIAGMTDRYALREHRRLFGIGDPL